MAQGDKRLFFNTRERFLSDDMNRLQAIEAAERAARLRGANNDRLGDWYGAGGFQTPVVSSSPSLAGDVYGGLMVQPDNAGYYLVQPGVAGFLEPAGVGTDDNPYRIVNDPGQQTPAVLTFTSNGGGGSPRWDVIECQPVDTVVAQESRYIFNPATGIASPILVDKVKAGRLTYRVRLGTVGAGFPGLAAGWMPLAVCCAPAGSTSLLTSDVWDVRPLVRERVRYLPVDAGTGVGYSPIVQAEYRCRTAAVATAHQWIGAAESSFNGYQAGGVLERSTPSTLAQFGGTGVTGGRAGLMNIDLADNQATYTLAANARVNLAALFPFLLPRWQRYSQVPVGAGRVPNGPRGILVATTAQPNAAGIFTGLTLPTAATFGASTHAGCLLASARGTSGAVIAPSMASKAEHYTDSQTVAASSIGVEDIDWDLTAGQLFPQAARRVLLQFAVVANNGAGDLNPSTIGRVYMGSEELCTFYQARLPGAVANPSNITLTCWAPTLARLVPTAVALPGTMRVRLSVLGIAPSITSATLRVLAWSSSDR